MLNTPIENMKGVGAARRQQLARLKIDTVGGLLKHVPRAYRDLTRLATIEQMREGQEWFGLLRIASEPKLQYIRRGFSVVRAKAEDDTGSITLMYYNQPYMKNNLAEGQRYYIFGIPGFDYGELRIVSPMTDREDVGEGERLLPVYRATAGLSQRVLRKLIRQCIDDYGLYIADGLPRSLRERYRLMPSRDAYEMIHFPPDFANKEDAVRSLAVEELLLLKEYLRNNRDGSQQAIAIPAPDERAFLSAYPYEPTQAQLRVMGEVRADIAGTRPMRRLLQGDVGSGKTTVAFYALYCAAQAGGQAAMIAPTEILAEQHYANATGILGGLGLRVGLLKAGMKKAQQREALQAIAGGGYDIVIGTHSLISKRVEFANLTLVVADEQHRFGVQQRALMSNKSRQAGEAANESRPQAAHTLIMSATPIPRTLALIIYGDLDISVLDEMPAGRQPVQTRVVGADKRADMYRYIAKQAQQGDQAYVVCPLIEEEDAGRRSVQSVYKEVAAAMPGINVALLHGRQKQADKDAAISGFSSGEIQVLVSTTVVEVGVDVPNATIIAIEEAERFGLAQLHQLRGRVGRGSKPSWCFLSAADGENERLKALCATGDGFEIARTDLELRGPGELLGTQQHGAAGLWVSRLLSDAGILGLVEQIYEQLERTEYRDEKRYILEKARERFSALAEEIALN